MQHDHLGAIVAGSPSRSARAGGPLEGVEAVVKDCFAVAGHTSSFGLARWRETHDPAVADAAVVTRLLGAGAELVGLTALDQLAFSLRGDLGEAEAPRNPRNPGFLCGGSSSGSAAAVAGGLASLGIGTDTAGSTRVPAAMCGIHGLRPTWGNIDTAGCLALAPTFDTVGLLAANPVVLARAVAVLGSPAGSPHRLRRVLVDHDLAAAHGPGGDPGPLLEAAALVAAELGTTPRPVSVTHLFRTEVGRLMSRLQGREVWALLGQWATANGDALDPDVRRRLERCREFAAENRATVEVDLEDRRRLTELLWGLMAPDALLVVPALGAPAPTPQDDPAAADEFRRSTLALTSPAGLAGWPQLTWSRPGPGRAHERAVGLLGLPGTDLDLAGLLGRLWQREVAAWDAVGP